MTNAQKNVEQKELPFIANGTATLEDSLALSNKVKYTLTIQSRFRAPWYFHK